MRPDVASGAPQRRWRDGPHGLHLGTCDGHCVDLLRLQGTASAVRSREQARSAVGAGQAEVVAGADFSLKRHFLRRALSKISLFRVGRLLCPVGKPSKSRHRARRASRPTVRKARDVSPPAPSSNGCRAAPDHVNRSCLHPGRWAQLDDSPACLKPPAGIMSRLRMLSF